MLQAAVRNCVWSREGATRAHTERVGGTWWQLARRGFIVPCGANGGSPSLKRRAPVVLYRALICRRIYGGNVC